MKFSSGKTRKTFKTEWWRVSLVVSFLSLFCTEQSFGTHISGAEITYQWISGNTFQLTLTLYRDCSGISAPNNPTIKYSSVSCNKKLNVTLTKVPGTGQEITHPCSTAVTTCKGGTYAGIQEYQYTATVTLPAQCTDWVFGYDICCRNCAITTLNFNGCANVPATYVEATLNNLAAPSNSSPVFTNIPVTFVCIGQPFNYNHGAYDSNGDSIVYSLIPPRSAAGTNVVYQSGYSATRPISSSPLMTLDNVTGDISMNPTNIEVSVMAVLVSEYRNGVLIGSVVRDMEIWTQPCNNILPTATGFNGTNNFSIVACPGTTLDVTINSADGNAGQTTTMTWNDGIPGAIFTTAGSPFHTGHLLWTPTQADARTLPYTFTVTVNDNNCPTVGVQTYSYSIYVPSLSITASSTSSGCSTPGSGTASAIAAGKSPLTYTWNPGGIHAASIGSLSPGTYTVTVAEANGCTASASTTVNSKPAVAAFLAGSTNVSCHGAANGTATINASGGTPPYTYSWSPAGGNSASATNLSAGTYSVTVTDAGGCKKIIPVFISEPASLVTTLPSITHVACYGDNTGSASVSVSGGTPPYQYFWSPGGNSTNTSSGLFAGNYSVIITDNQGCTNSMTININQPLPLQVSISASNATCGLSNGSALAAGSGGSAPYTYQWSSGESSPAITGKSAGGYAVLVSDANGCTATGSTGISNIAGPTVSVSSFTPVSCHGGQNGRAAVSVNSGTPPFTYQWTPSGGNTTTANGLAEGNYTVSVTDSNNCISAQSVTITSPVSINLTLTSTEPGCKGETTGSVQSAVSGGSGPYTYSWSPGGNSGNTLNNISAGNYQLTVTDNSGCTQTAGITLHDPSLLSGSLNTSVPATCFGNSTGAASVNASGGSAPYVYSWSPSGGNLSSAAGLNSGNYFVQITDAHNCTTVIPVAITQPPVLNTSMNNSQLACAGDANGSLTINATGGTAPYMYLWTPDAGNTSSVSNLSAGNYKVTVTDMNGCTSSVTAAINQPPPLAENVLSLDNVLCYGGNDGAAAMSLSGGTGPYTYSWSNSGTTIYSSTNANAGNYTVGNLHAGIYQVLFKDANNCSLNTIVAINEPEQLGDSVASVNPVSCYSLANGSASLLAFGGTEPYTYDWSPVSVNASSASGLAAGTYSVRVTDANGCTSASALTILQPPPLIVSTYTAAATCGTSNGSATLQPTGGVLPYSYSWNTGTSASNNLTGLSAGTYIGVTTDQNGCTDTSRITISNASTMSVANSVNAVTCHGGNTGSASVNVTGGLPPYQYVWSPNVSTVSQATGLSAGTYSVTITDGNSCVQIVSLSVNEPPALSTSIASSTNVSCHGGNDGTASVTANGGTAPYTYQWNQGANNLPSANMLVAGTYTVRVTDNSGCSSSSQISISEPPPLADSFSSTPTACGSSNGSATINASGGSPPYSYSWSTGAGNTVSLNNISAGNYSVTITDSKNCTKNATVSVSNINGPSLTVSSVNDATCSGGNTGSASVNALSGTPPYTFQWFPLGGNSSSASGLQAGSYSVQVTDANQCITSIPLTIAEPPPLSASVSSTPLLCAGSANGSVSLTVSGGIAPYQYVWTTGEQTASIHSLAAGNYAATVTDAHGCSQTVHAVVTQPTQILVVTQATPVSCYGFLNGHAAAQASGGTPPFTYDWLPNGGNLAAASSLAPGNYSLVIRDANGCSDSASVFITSPPAIQISATVNDVNCFGGNDGQARVALSGGTAPFSLQWNSGDTTTVRSNLASGNYSVTVTDQQGCTSTVSLTVSEPDVLKVVTTNPSPICIGQSVVLSTLVKGGNQPYTYSWSDGEQIPSITVSPAVSENFVLTVTDAKGCTAVSNPISVSVNPPLLAAHSGSDTICAGNSATLQTTASGGNGGPYTYLWNDGSSSASITVTPVQTTTYTVLVIDQCTLLPARLSIPVNVKPVPVANFLPDPLNGCAPLSAAFTDLTSGCATCTYEWSFGDGATSTGKIGEHVYSVPGQYTVIHAVSDGIGCMGRVEIPAAVNVFPPSVSEFTVTPELVSLANPLATFTDQSSNASQWSWDFGDRSGISTNENPSYVYKDTGTYTIRLIVSSLNGCNDTSYKKIKVRGEFAVYIPNAFTPNGDGINDYFMPLMLGASDFEMLIFDRWGLKIFETNSLKIPWDGKVEGKENTCQNDVYVYIVKLRDAAGESHEFIGHVSLVK